MAKPKTDKDTPPKAKKIIDVARPNDTPPSETSKPVIITHRPLMRDPMMAAPEADESPAPAPVKLPEPVETATPAVMKHERMLVPPSEAKPEAPIEPEESKEPAEPTKPVSKMLTINSFKPRTTTPDVPEKEAPSPEKKLEVKPDTKPETKTEAPKPYTVTESSPKKDEPLSQEAQEAKDAEEEDERQKHLDKLVEDGTYFLPVDAVNHKKAKRNTIIGLLLALIIGALWFVAALDAGLIQIEGVEAPTNFLSN